MKTIKNVLLKAIILFSLILNSQEKTFEVKVIGSGTPILLFPGFTCTGEVWNDISEELSKTNECHIFTFAGFGNVPPIEKPWLTKIKEGITQYISSKNLNNPTLIGHSMGGVLSLWLAIENKFKYNKIIAVDALPSTGALMIPNFNSELIVYDNPYSKRLLEMSVDEFEKMATQMASGMTINKDKHAKIKGWMLQSDRETYVHGYTDLLKLDLREAVSKIESSVTILAATHPFGEENVKKTFEAQYKNLDNYTIQYATESAHFIMYDQPEWLLNAIKSEL